MVHRIVVAWLLALPWALGAQPLECTEARRGPTEVPVEIARPAGPGPWPPVFDLHARRGFEDVDREHRRIDAAGRCAAPR